VQHRPADELLEDGHHRAVVEHLHERGVVLRQADVEAGVSAWANAAFHRVAVCAQHVFCGEALGAHAARSQHVFAVERPGQEEVALVGHARTQRRWVADEVRAAFEQAEALGRKVQLALAGGEGGQSGDGHFHQI